MQPTDFIHDDFLLHGETARSLYHGFAKDLPIIDYHSHLPPSDIATNRRFDTLTAIWLEGDHYKWRAMRARGIDEHYITGTASDYDKFLKWSETVPHTLRNPLYHWTHLELSRYFGIGGLLNVKTAESIYSNCNAQLSNESHFTKNLLIGKKVEVVCTTDDPSDDLSNHLKLKAENFQVKVLPTFRPDQVYSIDDAAKYNQYLDKLAKVTGKEISSYDDLLSVLKKRIDFFEEAGCRLADHGLEFIPVPDQSAVSNPEYLFKKLRDGQTLQPALRENFRFMLLADLGRMYHEKGWTQQFHLGAIRNNNSRMLKALGANTGYDSIGDFSQAKGIAALFSLLDEENRLARTILYNLNPADNELFATMAGNFNRGPEQGKIQYGSGWWFLDQKDGMEKQLNTLSNMGLLSGFVGMLTDSRSFLSYPRHEYFRRILCNLIGNDVDRGELPKDQQLLGGLIQNICYHNAKNYFGF
ncbi:MAG: glucuronate isomerase [Bacteroidetes bacterium]|nr:glucuronate isomerase [Bacteroidota bacterium]